MLKLNFYLRRNPFSIWCMTRQWCWPISYLAGGKDYLKQAPFPAPQNILLSIYSRKMDGSWTRRIALPFVLRKRSLVFLLLPLSPQWSFCWEYLLSQKRGQRAPNEGCKVVTGSIVGDRNPDREKPTTSFPIPSLLSFHHLSLACENWKGKHAPRACSKGHNIFFGVQ